MIAWSSVGHETWGVLRPDTVLLRRAVALRPGRVLRVAAIANDEKCRHRRVAIFGDQCRCQKGRLTAAPLRMSRADLGQGKQRASKDIDRLSGSRVVRQAEGVALTHLLDLALGADVEVVALSDAHGSA